MSLAHNDLWYTFIKMSSIQKWLVNLSSHDSDDDDDDYDDAPIKFSTSPAFNASSPATRTSTVIDLETSP